MLKLSPSDAIINIVPLDCDYCDTLDPDDFIGDFIYDPDCGFQYFINAEYLKNDKVPSINNWKDVKKIINLLNELYHREDLPSTSYKLACDTLRPCIEKIIAATKTAPKNTTERKNSRGNAKMLLHYLSRSLFYVSKSLNRLHYYIDLYDCNETIEVKIHLKNPHPIVSNEKDEENRIIH